MRRIGTAALVLAVLALAYSTALASPIALTNADFSSGLTGWTTFTTANGTLGPSPLPSTQSFDVDGDLISSQAAWFQVGEVSFTGVLEGGGIFQDFTTGAGQLQADADIAAFFSGGNNAAAGVFSLLIDGVVIDTVEFGGIDASNADVTERDTLSGTVAVSAGTHEIRFLITRPFQAGGGTLGGTPFQYVDDVALDGPSAETAVPEPTTLSLLGLGLVGTAARRWRQRKAS